MTHPHDGSSIDLEKQLARYLAERRVTRRYLLDRIAKVGAAAALGPVIAACTSGSATPAPASAAAPSATAAASASESAAASASAEPTPVPSPEAELFVYNWADYMGEDVVPSFEDKYGVKVTYDFFDNYDTMYAKIGQDGGGYDVTFPTSVDIPALLAQNLVQPLDLSLIPNLANLGAEWKDPGYDPGNAHSVPYMWWTTGIAYDSDKVEGTPTSWDTLWDEKYAKHIAMLDDYREAFAAALFRLGLDPNTTNEADLDKALAELQAQKPLVRTYTTDDIGVLSSGDAWVSHAWGSDVYQVVEERPSVKFFIPSEGGIRGSDTAVMLANAKHPIAAQLFLNHLLDAQVSASNTNYIGYMGPNAAAKEFIDPAILADPTVNPDQAVIDTLAELLDLGTDAEKYTSRWETLRAGA
ncbi:MAG TPA: spermidine/putrescine ABC transporter substrate-binding protein [Candidatus Limnocylindrales bacterium]|nr:spermidine/putrescine ABC transporter substrate-binding protein [Candidatus Limnocylindrales bacterium]